MKLGCASWIFCDQNYGPPYDESIRLIGEMGFECLELIASDISILDQYYTKEAIVNLRSLYESYGMELSEFVVHAPILTGLKSLDTKENGMALDLFKRATDVAYGLGSKAMNLVSNWLDFDCIHGYPPAFITPFVNGSGLGTPKWHMEFPDFGDYQQIWDNYMVTLGKCLSIAQSAGMSLNIEGHTNVIVGNTDAMLRMFDVIQSDDLGINFDTSWHLMQREYLPLALQKLGSHVKHLHMRDGDGLINYSLPCGMGIIDWLDLFETLKKIGFDGTCSLEIGAYADMRTQVSFAKATIDEAMKKAGIR